MMEDDGGGLKTPNFRWRHLRTLPINSDSQAAILVLDSHIIKTNSTLKAVQALKNLADSNQVFLWCIPAHQGFDGNERADELAKLEYRIQKQQ